MKRIAEFTNADQIIWGEYVKLGDQIRIDARVVRNGPLNARRLTSRRLGPRLSERVDVWSGRQRREEQQRGYGDAADTERA